MDSSTTSLSPRKIILPIGLLGALAYAVGGSWDQMIHVQQGHTLLATPHLVIGGGILAYVVCGILAFMMWRHDTLPTSKRAMAFVLASYTLLSPLVIPFLAWRDKKIPPIGLLVIMLGQILLTYGIVMDESWHWIFGLDMTAWSPPHVAILFGMGNILFGLALYEVGRNHFNNTQFGRGSTLKLVALFASIFFVTLFFFVDFDAPGILSLVEGRPAFSYIASLSGVTVFILLISYTITRRVGIATASALCAWAYYTFVGLLLGTIDTTSFEHQHSVAVLLETAEAAADHHSQILIPFPIVFPALAFDLLLLGRARKWSFPLSFKSLLPIAFVATSVCFVSIAAWAQLYTQLPQQLPAESSTWLIWYAVFVPAIAVLVTLTVFLLNRWIGRSAQP